MKVYLTTKQKQLLEYGYNNGFITLKIASIVYAHGRTRKEAMKRLVQFSMIKETEHGIWKLTESGMDRFKEEKKLDVFL